MNGKTILLIEDDKNRARVLLLFTERGGSLG